MADADQPSVSSETAPKVKFGFTATVKQRKNLDESSALAAKEHRDDAKPAANDVKETITGIQDKQIEG